MITVFAFLLLIIFTVSSKSRRETVFSKSLNNWVLDLLNLPIQGILIPFLQAYVLYNLMLKFVPQYKGILDLPGYIVF